jgi:hypothetical protein
MPGSWEREIAGMLQGTGTAGGSFKRRPWLRVGCCADDDDNDDEDDYDDVEFCTHPETSDRQCQE